MVAHLFGFHVFIVCPFQFSVRLSFADLGFIEFEAISGYSTIFSEQRGLPVFCPFSKVT